MKVADFLWAALVGALVYQTAVMIPCMAGRDKWWKNELVRRGYAEYVLDAAHDRQWRWKEER